MRKKHGKKHDLGYFGEKLVQHYFTNAGYEVQLSDDRFDENKDMLINGVPTEVKTGQRFEHFYLHGKQEPAFSISLKDKHGNPYYNQYMKCKTVQELIFVDISKTRNSIIIYKSPEPQNRNFIQYTRKDGSICVLILISTLEKLFECNNTKIIHSVQNLLS